MISDDCILLKRPFGIACSFGTILLGLGWMRYSYLDIEYPVFVLICLISGLCGYIFPNALLSNKQNIKRMIAIALISFYSSFVTVGSKRVMFPIEVHISAGRIIEICMNALWYFIAIISFVYILNQQKGKRIGVETKRLSRLDYGILFLSVFAPLVAVLIAFYPGIFSYDSNLCLAIYAHDLSNMVDNQPFFYVLFLKAIISITDSTVLVISVQILMWCAVWMEGFRFLNKSLRISFGGLLVIAVLLGLNSANLLYLNTVWKDIPYSICILLMTILFAELAYGCKVDIPFCIKMIVALCGICMFRKNGPVVYGTALIALIVWGIRNREVLKKLLYCIIISMIIIWTINVPIYNLVGVQKDEGEKGAMYIGMSQDLFAAYKYGSVSDDTKELLTVLGHGNLDTYEYNPYWAHEAYDLDVSPVTFIKCYMDSFCHNPRIMLKAMLLRQDCLWNVFPGEESWVNLVNYFGEWDDTTEWMQYYPARVWSKYGNFVIDIISYPGNNASLSILIWRSGAHLLFLIIMVALVLMMTQDYKILYLLAPVFGQIISLFLSTGWADFRYYWCVNVVSLYIIVICIFRIVCCFDRKNEAELKLC